MFYVTLQSCTDVIVQNELRCEWRIIVKIPLLRQVDIIFDEFVQNEHSVYIANRCALGFSTANDRQRIAAFIRRSKRTGFCSSQLDDFNSLCDTADTQLFTKILHNPRHVLQALLRPPADRNYNLRDRLHNRQLPGRMSHLTDCNLIVRMLLFCDSYCLYCPVAYLGGGAICHAPPPQR